MYRYGVVTPYLSTDCIVVNNRGEFFTRLVKTNSNRVLNFANTQSACVCPRSFDLACLIFADITVFKPILKLILLLLCDTQSTLKFVTISEPRSPLFPFVSSTLLIESSKRANKISVNNILRCQILPVCSKLLTNDLFPSSALQELGLGIEAYFSVLPDVVGILLYCTFKTHVLNVLLP